MTLLAAWARPPGGGRAVAERQKRATTSHGGVGSGKERVNLFCGRCIKRPRPAPGMD
jgi:hypothetical protein